jgi:phosphate transport system substrate-binding protein
MSPEITSINPDLGIVSSLNAQEAAEHSFPISVARRLLGSSSTNIFTKYLHKTCPSEWSEQYVGSAIEWPEDTLVCEGSTAMTSCITNNPGAIGYVDSGHGHSEQLQEVALEMDHKKNNGFYLTSQDSFKRGGILSALEEESAGIPESADFDWSGVDLINQVEVSHYFGGFLIRSN